MKKMTLPVGVLVSAVVLSACGGPGLIDEAKESRLSQCPAHTLGELANGYFITGLDSKTMWRAFGTETGGVYRVTAEGQLLFAGGITTADLAVRYDQTAGTSELLGVTFNGREQPFGIAEALIGAMCDEAG